MKKVKNERQTNETKADFRKILPFLLALSLGTFFTGYTNPIQKLFVYYSYSLDISAFGGVHLQIDVVNFSASVAAALLSAVFFNRANKARVLLLCLVGIALASLSALWLHDTLQLVLATSALSFFTTGLSVFCIAGVVVYLRKNTESRHLRLSGLLLVSVVCDNLGSTVGDVFQIMLTSNTYNSFMESTGWRLVFALPALFALALIAALILVKQQGTPLLKGLDGDMLKSEPCARSHTPSCTTSLYYQTLFGVCAIFLLMYFQGDNLIVNILPDLLHNTSWTTETQNFYDLGRDVLTFVSALLVFLAARRISFKRMLVWASTTLVALMACAIVFAYTSDGTVSKNVVVYILGNVFVIGVYVASDLAVWVVPTVIAVRYSPSCRIAQTMGILTAVGMFSLMFSSLTSLVYYVIPTSIASVLVLLVVIFVIPRSNPHSEPILAASGQVFEDDVSSEPVEVKDE